MIEKLRLVNFQSHKKSVLKFHPNVNAIVGTSNSGKTAILRALYWLRYNRPSGLAFISHWNRDKKGVPLEETSVRVTMPTATLTRERTKDFNGYRIVTEGADEWTLEAVGLEVPPEIETRTRLGEVNIQKQMDAPFLLSESAAEVARFFNKEIRLDLIDRILSGAETDRRRLNQELKRAHDELDDKHAELKRYATLDEAIEVLEAATEVDAVIGTTKDEHARLTALVEEAARLHEAIATADRLASDEILELVDIIDQADDDITALKTGYTLLRRLVNDLTEQTDAIATAARTIEKLTASLPRECPVCGKPLEDDVCAE